MSVEAGHVDRSVLFQQESHISNFIKPDNLDNTLRVRRSDNLIGIYVKAGVLHRRIRSCLNEMGFYGILCCGDCIYDNHLITALVERWRRETHTFHLRCGEATITLQDVALIWGLNVDGEPIIGTDVSHKFPVWQSICYDWLAFVPVQSDFRSNTIKLTTLHAHCMQTMINNYSPEVQVQQYTRCVALMIIGGCMLPDSEGCVVKMLYLNFLRDISRVRSYSWASTVLTFLYHELWKHAYRWTHTTTYSVRIIHDVLDIMGDSQRDGTSTIANICKGLSVEDLSHEDLIEELKKSIATAAFLHELTLKTPQQQQHHARSSTRRRQGRGDDRNEGDDLQSFATPDWRQSTSQTPLTPASHQTSTGTDVGPSYRDVGSSYVFSSPLSSSFFYFAQLSGGNVQADQGTPYQQSEFQTPPAYTTYQTSFMEIIFGGIPHQYEGEQPIFDTSAIPYMGYSLPESAAMSLAMFPRSTPKNARMMMIMRHQTSYVGANVCHVRLIVVLVIV
ncbi:serine/threonine-protein phosphatase 7 long form [Dorcoceras hygrometricum]|uniref:Serine/threonine-protein phosphatase 7 long form n=1 Tax=Dorcoceras hygrometricum TaxID=472368 RepID=A0A2Z7AU79_9LAMI|nr:serine/threonine-protein phosphatase 7 long form [Dorcoceras hygrometricum]